MKLKWRKFKIHCPHFLGFNMIWRDISTLNSKNKAMIISIGFIIFATFFINLPGIISSNYHWFTFNNNKNLKLWQQILFATSNIAAFSYLLYFVLKFQNKVSQFFWHIIALFSSGLFAFSSGYIALSQFLLLFYLPWQLYRFIGLRKNSKLALRSNFQQIKLNNWQLLLSASLLLPILTAIFFFETKFLSLMITNNYQFEGQYFERVIDSILTALIIINLFLLRRKKKWQLAIWIIYSIVFINFYWTIGNTINTNMIFIGMMMLGYYLWTLYLHIKKGQR